MPLDQLANNTRKRGGLNTQGVDLDNSNAENANGCACKSFHIKGIYFFTDISCFRLKHILHNFFFMSVFVTPQRLSFFFLQLLSPVFF